MDEDGYITRLEYRLRRPILRNILKKPAQRMKYRQPRILELLRWRQIKSSVNLQ